MSGWTCRTSGPTATHKRRAEVVFLSPAGKVHRAHAPIPGVFQLLEVYLRQLGRDQIARRKGWTVRVPERYKRLPGWLIRGRKPRLIRYLEIFDPRGRRTLVELKDPATEDLLEQLVDQLFEEKTDAKAQQPRQLQVRPVPEGHSPDGERRHAVPHQGLAGHDRQVTEESPGQRRLQEWKKRHGLLGVKRADPTTDQAATG